MPGTGEPKADTLSCTKKPFVCRYHPFAGPYDGGFFGICINRLSFLNHQSRHRRRMSRRSCSCLSQVTTPIPSNSQGFDPFDSSFWSQGLGKWTREPQVVELLLPTGNVAVDLSWLGCWDYFEIGLNASFQPLELCTFNHQATLQTSADLNFFAKKHRFGVRLTGLVILQELFKIYLRHGLKAWRSGWVGGDWSPPWVFCPTKIRGRIRRAVWSNWSAHSVLPICWMMGRPGCAPIFWY